MEDFITISKRELERQNVINQVLNKKILQEDGAKLLKLSVRHFRRLQKSYEKEGIQALISKKRAKASHRKLDHETEVEAVKVIKEKYPDFGPTFAHEKLTVDDGFNFSVSTVRRIMIDHGILKVKKRKLKKVYGRRRRRLCEGELIQIDGSFHDWFEGRAPACCLLVFIDDATSKLMHMRFAPSESLQAYYETLHGYLIKHGIPEALYSDKYSVFRVNQGENIEERTTNFNRALKTLGIKLICANSPQAKGRVERANGTLQDRLVKEMRLNNICSIDEANSYLNTYIQQHNKKFAKEAASPDNAHKKFDYSSFDLDYILSEHVSRKISKTLSFQYQNTHYQIIEENLHKCHQMIGQKVDIYLGFRNTIKVFYKEKELKYENVDLFCERPQELDSKEINKESNRWLKKKKRYKPSKDHPYKRNFKLK